MRAEPVPSAEVDVCDACGGVWVDWFDGPLAAIAAEAEAVRMDHGALPPGVQGAPARANGAPGCPRCMRALVPEFFRFTDAAPGELITGVELLRCSDCAGSFVPRSSAHLLLDRALAPRTATLWEALVELLRRMLA